MHVFYVENLAPVSTITIVFTSICVSQKKKIKQLRASPCSLFCWKDKKKGR